MRWSDKELREYNARRAAGGASAGSTKTLNRAPRVPDPQGVTTRQRKAPNRTEREYEETFLKPALAAREITRYGFEEVTLILGVDTRYTPDYLVRLASGRLQVHEVKGGYKREDAFKTFKVAAKMFGDCFDFLLCEKSNSGEWKVTQYR